MYFSVQRPIHSCAAPLLLVVLHAMPLWAADTPPPPDNGYLRAIESLERDFGPYHNELAQHLTSLGIELKNNGRNVEAEEVLERAMHLNRINEGLYSLSQVPILEQLIEANVGAGDWERASENHQYLFWLHRRNFDSDDPRMLPTLEKLSKWHLNAFVMGLDGGMFHHLINAHNLFASAADIIEHSFGTSDLRLVEALRGITVSNYYLAAYQSYSKPSGGFEANFGSSGSRDEEQMRLEQYILRSYSNGKDAITRIQQVYEQNPEAPADAAVRAQVDLADWQMLFNRPHSALDLYHEAIEKLTEQAGGTPIIEELFSRPVELPNLSYMKLDTNKGDNSDEYVIVKFDVTATGRARNIDILESYPEDKVSIRSRVRNSLRVAKFRPRFVDGEPVTTESLTRRYVFTE